MKHHVIIIISLSSVIFQSCLKNRSDENFTRKQIVDLTKNEITSILNTEYLSSLETKNLKFRFRILPYIESKNEKINISDFLESYQIMVSYKKDLFADIEKNNFTIQQAIDQYHKVDLDLRYILDKPIKEEHFPTVVFMIQQGKIWPGVTSFTGVGLKIYLRMSIFNKTGEEIAYCQKRLFNSISSNDFFEKYILEEKSPFLNNLNELDSEGNESIIKLNIQECKKELEISNEQTLKGS